MRLLLDTHVILWWLTDADQLSDELKDRVDDEQDVYLSAASVWEIGIKQASGKLPAPPDLVDRILGSDLRGLAMTGEHATAAARLPPIHADPFDRMLVAQARLESLTLVTRDSTIAQYDVEILPA